MMAYTQSIDFITHQLLKETQTALNYKRKQIITASNYYKYQIKLTYTDNSLKSISKFTHESLIIFTGIELLF